MLVKTYCAAVNGMEVTTVTVEVSITRGVLYHLTGLADVAVKESHDRIAAALLNVGYKFPVADITANLSPADLRKEGSSFDLPLAIAILAANEKMHSDRLGDYMLVGELSLDGTLQPIKGALPIAIKARAEKFKGLIVPKANEHEAAVVDSLDVYGMSNIMEVINFLNNAYAPEPCFVDTRKEFYDSQYVSDLDFADVRGQESVKRALEVAAAGSHNVIIQRYLSKISGPLLDRIDLQIELSALPFADISKASPGEASAAIRERVIKARAVQTERFKDHPNIHCNAQMTERMIHQYAEPDEQSKTLLRSAMERLKLSARAYNRILKVARTIADLENSEPVQAHHIAEAIGYRSLDRGDWAERGV